MYKDFCKNYPIISIEDPYDQDDWDSTAKFTAEGVAQVASRSGFWVVSHRTFGDMLAAAGDGPKYNTFVQFRACCLIICL